MSNEVKLSKADLDTLKSLYVINQTLKIVTNDTVLKTINESKSIACVAELETPFPRTFCIYDLREFISAINIIENPILDFSKDKYVLIKSEDGLSKLKYMDGSENLINSYFTNELKLPSEDITITVSAQQLKSVMTAALALKLEYVGFTASDQKIFLSTFDRNNGSGEETNGFSIEVGETADEFRMFYKTEVLTVLDGDCDFSISKRKISKVVNGSKTFMLALDANSTFS